MSKYTMVHESRHIHRRKSSVVEGTVTITENTNGGVRALCYCNYEDAERIIAALDLHDDLGSTGADR